MEQTAAGEKRKLGFSGRLTYPHASALREMLADALAGESVEICFGEVDEVDLSFVQLLCSALRTAEGAGREVTIASGRVPPGLSELVETAGMVSPLGRKDDSFWSRLAGKADTHG